MLRALVIALLLANLAWWAAHWPPLAEPLGLAASTEREPRRLERQVDAERIELLRDAPPSPLPLAAASGASGSAPATAPVCLEAGPMDDAGFNATRGALQQAGVGSDAWVEIRRELPGSYGIYMGRFADAEQSRRKAEELQRLGIAREDATGPLAPGLLLGRYTDAGQAQAAMGRLQARGVRTARVLTLVAPVVEHRLRLERAEPATQARLMAAPAPASGASAPATPAWRPCN